MRQLRAHLSYANVMATIAVFVAIGGGTAYAVNEWTGENIVDGSLSGIDIQDVSVKKADIGGNSITSSRIIDGHVITQDLGANAVTGEKVADGSLGAADIDATNIRSGAVATLAPGSCDPSNNCFMSDVRGFNPVAKRITALGGGVYCLIPLARNPDTDPAIVSVDDHSTVEPVGNASAAWNSATGVCSAGRYEVHTERIPTTGDPEAAPSTNVGFQIYVP